ncbi:peptide/nickel transport system substrate-binding protein [Catenulispora sp. EB89]
MNRQLSNTPGGIGRSGSTGRTRDIHRTAGSRGIRRTRRTGPVAVVVAGLSLSLVLAGCGGGSANPSAGSAVRTQTAAPVAVRQGGSLVIGAEQEPDCADWLGTCSGAVWGEYIMKNETIPQVFTVAKQGADWVPAASPLMAGEPTITGDAQPKITYRLNPKAVWSDGQPITSADLKYTALQVRDGQDIFDKTGYSLITSIDTPDPQTAVVTLSKSFGNWKMLFSGDYGVLPSHLLAGKDRDAVMKNGYSFSGGPWKIEQWVRGSSVTLVPNDKYWGPKPHLDKVTFQFTADTAAAFQAFRSGQLDALYPSPQLDVIDQIKAGLPNADIQTDAQSGNLEALWMNNARFPFDSTAVRQAVAYAIDRQALVTRLYGPLGSTSPAQSFNSPMLSRYAGTDFSVYHLDLAKVTALMTGAGWAKNADGIWAKDGRPAAFTITSLSGNKRRELIEQVLQAQLKQAGFTLTIKNSTAAEIFSKTAPAGDFDLGLWTIVDTFPAPTLDASFASQNIPGPSNGQAGINFIRSNYPQLDQLLGKVANTTDETARRQASLGADTFIANNVVSLPISAVPNVLLWNKRVGGPISINPSEGPWWNLAEWGLVS